MTDLAVASATELARGRSGPRRSRAASCSTCYLDRIERLDGPINAVVTLGVERARAEATAADDATARGVDLGPLHGLPITIKDAIETAGIRSTGGAVELTDHVPDRRRAGRRPAARGRRDRVRQDQPAALVGRPPDLQRDLRHDEQPVGPRPRPGRLVGRRRRRRWRAGSRASSSAPTSAARSASRRTAAACSGSSRASASSPSAATSTTSAAAPPTPTSTCSGRSPAAPTTSTCCSTCSPARRPSGAGVAARAAGRRRQATSRAARRGVARRPRLPHRCRLPRRARRTRRRARGRRRQGRGGPPARRLRRAGRAVRALIAAAISLSCPPRPPRRSAGATSRGSPTQKQRAALQRTWAEWFEGYDVLLCPVIPTRPSRTTRTATSDPDHDRRRRASGLHRQRSWTGLIGVVGLPSAVPPVGRTADGCPSACRSWPRTCTTAPRCTRRADRRTVDAGYDPARLLTPIWVIPGCLTTSDDPNQ